MEKEDRIRQKEQRKELSPAEKWQYFIDYYLWITIGVAAGIAVVIFLIVHFATKTSFVMGVMAVNTDGEQIEAKVIRPYIHSRLCGAKSLCREQKSTAAFPI